MADTKISALTAASGTALSGTFEFAGALDATTNYKVTIDQLRGLGWAVVTDFGFDTAGSASANTTAVHAARDSGATTLYFPAGGYSVNKLQANVSGQRWIIAGGCVLTLAASQNTDAIEVSAADVTIEGEGRTSVIDQNSAAQTGGSGIYVTGADRVTLRNLRVTDVAARGVNVTNSAFFEADHLHIDSTGTDNLFVEGNGGSDDCYIHDCRLTGGPSSGDADCISVHGNAAGGTVHRARIQNNYCEPNGSGMFAIEVGPFGGDDPTEDPIVTGNVIKATADCFGGISMDGCINGLVADNLYEQNGQTGTNSIAGIEIPGSDQMTITGNIIVGEQAMIRGIVIDRSSRITVTDNVIDGWANTGANLNGGIVVTTSSSGEHCNDNIIESNTLTHPATSITSAGVALQCNNAGSTVKRNLIHGNIFIGASVTNSQAILFQENSGTLDYNVCAYNIMSNLTYGVVGTPGANGIEGSNLTESVTTPT